MVMHGPAELILGLLIAVAALVTIARRLENAYPIFLVIGGLMLALLPAVDRGRRCRICGWRTDGGDELARRE